MRGRTILISVNSPGCVSTSIDPPCCLTMTSWLMDRPSPVPSPAGLVVKNGLKIFSFTSGGMPVPLSRIADFHAVPEVLGGGSKRWLVIAAICFRSALGRCIKAIRNQIKQSPCDVLREDVGCTGGRIKGSLQGDIEALLFGPRPVIGEIEAFLDEGVDIDGPVLTRAFARVQQHVLDDGIGTLAVLHDLVEIALQRVRQFVDFSSPLFVEVGTSSSASCNSSISSVETPEKLLTKLSGFLISWAMPAVS